MKYSLRWSGKYNKTGRVKVSTPYSYSAKRPRGHSLRRYKEQLKTTLKATGREPKTFETYAHKTVPTVCGSSPSEPKCWKPAKEKRKNSNDMRGRREKVNFVLQSILSCSQCRGIIGLFSHQHHKRKGSDQQKSN